MPLVSSTQTRAALVNLLIQQGADFSHVISLQNSDGSPMVLSGYSAKMQIRPAAGSATLILELSTANGRITINGLAGQITLNIPNATTTTLVTGSAVYDLEITDGSGIITRVMQGNVTLSPEVTI